MIIVVAGAAIFRKFGLPIFLMVASTAGGGIRGPGKYAGVVIFDRWDSCYLYSGTYLMYVSQRAKESLRAYRDQAIVVDAEEVSQVINPGDGLITKLKVIGPASEATADSLGDPPILDDLNLRVAPSFPDSGPGEILIELRNDGNAPRTIDMAGLAPTLFSNRREGWCINPGDGPSYAALTRSNVDLMHSFPAGSSCLVNSVRRTATLSLAPGIAFSSRFHLDPGEKIEVPLRFELSPGEYEFLAGYGGGVHAVRALASNRFSFDVDAQGRAHLPPGSTVTNTARPPRRTGEVCGTAAFDDGRPANNTRILLWPLPIGEREPRYANSVTTDDDGWFQMDSVVEGKYVLSALSQTGDGVFAGAVGGRRLAEAATLTLPSDSEACSYSITVYPQTLYTIRGRTEPASTSSGPRTIRLIQKMGDTSPFEVSVSVQPDGQYEFRNIPAGYYQMFAGWTGAGFEVTRDINDLRIEIRWPNH
jgi:hypothetical protein